MPMWGPRVLLASPYFPDRALRAEIATFIAAGLNEKMLIAIRDAVLRYCVVVIRDQKLSPRIRSPLQAGLPNYGHIVMP